jgi:hypothetical protein
MNDFIDLQGASGASYRFRLWAEGASHLPIAGNYVFVRQAGDAVKVVLAGLTNDLSTCRKEFRKAVSRKATHVYTRLNVSRATRHAEHDDLVAGCQPALVSETDI